VKVQQLYTKCLAQGAYYIESNGEAAVIDPLRDVDQYIKLAKQSNSKIKYVFETHFHADFVSGHLSLASLTGAQIVFGPKADPSFDALISSDNQVFKIGEVSLTVLHTPGHTLESTSFLLKDKNGNEHCIFTGDTLFLGDVGIPDVAQRYVGVSKEDLAGILYDSINLKIKPLPDDILVYPGHGAGSACGKNMMKETVDTLGNQKKLNYSLNGSLSKDTFITQLTKNLPEPPTYFPLNVKLNQQGYKDLSVVIKNAKKSIFSHNFLSIAAEENAVMLDLRSQKDFAKSHIPNSIFIGLDGGFAPWVGGILKNITKPILLIVDPQRIDEAIIRLARVGFDNVIGYLEGGFDAWIEANLEVEKISTISAHDFSKLVKDQEVEIYDVRNTTEFFSEHIVKAKNIPLLSILEQTQKILNNDEVYMHCAGGYRSIIANSILKSKGFHNIIDIEGGFSSIKKCNINITDYICPSEI
tara:strand:- start:1270 stop:2679 length:1410 start_codon:yes stop_codon:yes gene_type:complete